MPLTVITGPMFAGKTTELIRLVKRLVIARKRVLVVKPSIDDRYDESLVVTHDGLKSDAVTLAPDEYEKLYVLAANYDVIAVDEVQFFDYGVVEVLDKLADEKTVIVSGLNLDYRGEPFEVVRDLLVRADDVVFLKAVCTVCGGEATRTYRKIPSDDRIIVGGHDLYEARCRRHFQ